MNYIFWDIESSGSRTTWDAIVEFGACLTDDRFKELDRFNFRCRLKPTVIPDIGALLVNKSSVEMLKNSNLSHYQMVQEVSKKFSSWSPAIFASYNGISFDEEFWRKTLFKSLMPNIYQTNTNGSKRIDILNVARAAKLINDDAIKTTISDKGNPVFKLDQLSVANGIEHKDAHTAFSDSLATKSIAEIIYKKVNSVWQSSLKTISKSETEEYIENNKIFSSIEYFYGKARIYLCTHLLYHPSWKWSICFDLKNHPKDYINLSRADLKDAMKKSPKILRTIKTNKSPVILDEKAGIKEEPYNKIGLDDLNKRIELLKNNPKFIENISSILRDEAEEKQSIDQTDLYPEETIYSGGYASDKDKNLMKKFHESDWKNKLNFIDKFENPNNSYFAKVLIYEESPDVLSKEMYNEIHREFAERLLSTNSEKWATTSKFYSELDYLREKYTKAKDAGRLKLLDGYNQYVMDIQNRFENA